MPAKRLRATRVNQVWALDLLFDSTSDGRPLKALAMCDEFSRESIGRYLGRSITADDVVKVLDQAKTARGGPEFVRFDNGPEFIAAVPPSYGLERFVGLTAPNLQDAGHWNGVLRCAAGPGPDPALRSGSGHQPD